ncbi:MAG: N-acyl homoserine lactonase family protein [Proteobacteria bacterium]|nr:N-acyl homoserine lactonase family protein [Pseudomonadota bacterium]
MSLYSIWVLEYAVVPNYNVSGVLYGAHNQGNLRLPYAYVVIKGQGRVMMVDVGYNHRDYGKVLADRFGVESWHSPKDVLGQIGLSPEDVDTIFVTHAHFDHMGNLDDFPNAHVYVQEREIARAIWAMSQPPRLSFVSIATDPADVLKCVFLARSGRLTLIDGDCEDVLPGIDLRAAPDTHTFGSQYVVVRNDGRRSSADSWVLAGDLIYVYENIEGDGSVIGVEQMYVPVGVAVGSQTNLVFATEAIMRAAGGEVRRVIPVHERRLVDKFPSRARESGLRVSEICLAVGESSRL